MDEDCEGWQPKSIESDTNIIVHRPLSHSEYNEDVQSRIVHGPLSVNTTTNMRNLDF